MCELNQADKAAHVQKSAMNLHSRAGVSMENPMSYLAQYMEASPC
jgi:hypothetical protein